MRWKILFTAFFVLSLCIYGCKNKEEKKDKAVHGSSFQTIVPDNVKGAWSAVKFTIEDKKAKNTHDVFINLNSVFNLPGSDLKITVGDFLPDFRVEASAYTSASNQPDNPAVMLTVHEKDKRVFEGLLFAKSPEMHPFVHHRYNIKLSGALPSAKNK